MGCGGSGLNQSYSTQEYARAFIPLMLCQFPQDAVRNESIFVLHQNTYRYTGIYYDADDLQLAWVDEGSPAAKAGIQPGDRVLAVNGLPLDKSVEKLTGSHYKSFIAETWVTAAILRRFTRAKAVSRIVCIGAWISI